MESDPGTRDLLVGYVAHPAGGTGAPGLRVRHSGEAELNDGDGRWTVVATLGPRQLAELRDAVERAGILALPERVSRPAALTGGADCELWAELGDRKVHAVIEGWADTNPAARASRDLALRLQAMIAQAQAGHVE
jgi:hypothetical protein